MKERDRKIKSAIYNAFLQYYNIHKKDMYNCLNEKGATFYVRLRKGKIKIEDIELLCKKCNIKIEHFLLACQNFKNLIEQIEKTK
jgi:hypothetical protein